MKNPATAFILGFAALFIFSMTARLFFDIVIFGYEFNELNWLNIILTITPPAIAVGAVHAVIRNNKNKNSSR